MSDLERRIDRLESREQIREILVRYGLAVDDRDYELLGSLFTSDAVLRQASGVVKGKGPGVLQYFVDHLPELGPTNHFVHGEVVEFDDADPDRATGVVTSHAEVLRQNVPMITAMRYLDTYRRDDGVWRFAERVQTYMYFLDVRDYPTYFGSPLRIRTNPDDPKPGDWPSSAN